jgi:hypothetical protein
MRLSTKMPQVPQVTLKILLRVSLRLRTAQTQSRQESIVSLEPLLSRIYIVDL